MRWTCALHKKILRDLQSEVFSDLPTQSVDLLPEHSHQLLLVAEDLVASLYAPQDPAAVQQAVDSVNEKFQAFRETLFGRPQNTVDSELRALEDRMAKVAINESTTSPGIELPHGYATSFRVLATCISKASEEAPPQE